MSCCYFSTHFILQGFLVRRHSGVLGLAALVESSPYSVPRWLPEVLEEMAQHLYGPMTIQVIYISHPCLISC